MRKYYTLLTKCQDRNGHSGSTQPRNQYTAGGGPGPMEECPPQYSDLEDLPVSEAMRPPHSVARISCEGCGQVVGTNRFRRHLAQCFAIVLARKHDQLCVTGASIPSAGDGLVLAWHQLTIHQSSDSGANCTSLPPSPALRLGCCVYASSGPASRR